MTLEFCEDYHATDWLVRSRLPWEQLATFGPEGFEAYARLRFLPDPTDPGQSESDAEIPDDHPEELAQTQAALARLAAFTATPGECYFCVWDGYSAQEWPSRLHGRPPVRIPNRSFALLRGSVHDIDDWLTTPGLGTDGMPPAFAWPADHGWCFARDVDPHWAGIGASRAAIDALLADPLLDVVTADPAATQPTYY